MYVERLLKLYERLPVAAVSRRGAAPHRAVGDRASRSRRQLGRHSTAVGVLADRARSDGLRARSSGDAQGHRGHAAASRSTTRDGWRFLACMSPVWDTAWAVRALALAGFDAIASGDARARSHWLLREQIPDDAPGDWRMKCTGNARQRLGVRVRQRRLSRHRRHDDRRAGAARGRRSRRSRAMPSSARGAGRWRWIRATARGRRSIATTRASCSTECRSRISAR